MNDGGSEHPNKTEAQSAFLDFFGIPAGSELRKQRGIYRSKIVGPVGKRVQVILLDTRFHRGPLASLTFAGRTIYVPDDDPTISMLGEPQWKWLAERLREEAEVRLVVSSIQVLPQDHPFEKWRNLPRERRRLLKLLGGVRTGAVLLLSGDQHLGELTELTFEGFDFLEATSSGLTHDRGELPAPNNHRIGEPLIAKNFGLLEIDWGDPNPLMTVRICDIYGKTRIREQRRFSELTPAAVSRTR
jgi:alkaline phosphatase D